MPQINRVRVNNVKYNFGTQFYDDFLMRFSCKNTIYDLANGGGKSVLMLLLLQNLIPNCTLDEKQPIEKLFRTADGSSVIHSLIEWKLDPCYRKDNYKYMVTGFCARKAKDNDEDKKDTANIEYFNYCIFYREFGDNDIKNLPLSNGKERITYQGLKSYLKDLEKKDFGVSVKIFERKNEYQKFLTEYGIFESQWEIVRGINKTEGHVRTYFENNYRTARKVVEDLLIEEIIEKSFINRLGVGAENDMAATLLDIKDKLLELTNKKETIDNYDRQVEALETFAAKLVSFKDVFDKKAKYEGDLVKSYFSVKNAIATADLVKQNKQEQAEGLKKLSEDIGRDILVCDILGDEKELASLKVELKEAEEKVSSLYGNKALSESELNLMQIVRYYEEYLTFTKKRDEVKVTIDNRLRDFDELNKELGELSRTIKDYIDKNILSLGAEIDKAKKTFDEDSIALSALKEKIADLDKNIAVSRKLISEYEKDLENLYSEQNGYMKKVSLIVADEMKDKWEANSKAIEDTKGQLSDFKKKIENDNVKLSESMESGVKYRLTLDRLTKELTETKEEIVELTANSDKVNKLLSVYDESDLEVLENKLAALMKNSMVTVSQLEMEINRLKIMQKNYSEGIYSFDEPQYMAVLNYLSETYGEDVVAGDTWLHSLNAQTRRDILKRVPFITHSIVVKNDFDRVKADVVLKTICKGAYVIPVVGENILYETRNAVSVDNIYFAFKDISFLADEEATLKEIGKLNDEIESVDIKLSKAAERLEVIREDYEYILWYRGSVEKKYNKLSRELPELGAQIERVKEMLASEEDNKNTIKERLKHYQDEVMALEQKLLELGENDRCFAGIKDIGERIALKKNAVKDLHNNLTHDENELSSRRLSYDELKSSVLHEENLIDNLSAKLSEIKLEWDSIYAPYYDENAKIAPLSEDDAKARFAGLKAIVSDGAKDVSDKEKLYETYEAARGKALSEIEYLGADIENASEIYNNQKIRYKDEKDLYKLRDRIKEIDASIKMVNENIKAMSANCNRLEGSIEHQISSIKDKYGEFVRPEVGNVAAFREGRREALKQNKENIKALLSDMAADNEKYTGLLVIAKDMERIMKSAGITLPENAIVSEEETFDDYESIVEAFDAIIKEEAKRRENFNKDKAELVSELQKLLAFELAYEVKESLYAPKNGEDAIDMMNSIASTNECIILERDRVTKGIEDMLRIKDNFENRCIQTCMNIRTELDKLPKLSRITMDDEVISIIGLNIPYVKDEFIKERMSSYIQEITVTSESFKDGEERLRYIRGKLSWKKLFSVIVTDMNSIKLNLYKRERIGTQSRYLRYEEAVGSTGQSQGIYIQFLIAIINYISSINASGRDTGTIGKTIFIDNPFGAAKDIYIWEPIFKLLKTNHVQLIVPTRGSSAAITGRFDVNYILGQKLVGDKQQTVVVDYRSMADTNEADYSKLEYEQATFEF